MNGGVDALASQGLERLGRLARDDPRAAAPEAARQFEALLVQTLLKASRPSAAGSGAMGHSMAARMYRDLLEQQLAQLVAGQGGLGVARSLAGVLAPPVPALREATSTQSAMTEESSSAPADITTPAPTSAPRRRLDLNQAATLDYAAVARAPAPQSPGERKAAFLAEVGPAARRVEERYGVPAELVIAQAALETGWGRHRIRGADGADSFNLFGIKAGPGWKGARIEQETTEYVDGQAQRRIEPFRAYPSFEAAFDDYARLLSANPRYAAVREAPDAAAAARAVQAAGYATDPAYADKLVAVMRGIDFSDG